MDYSFFYASPPHRGVTWLLAGSALVLLSACQPRANAPEVVRVSLGGAPAADSAAQAADLRATSVPLLRLHAVSLPQASASVVSASVLPTSPSSVSASSVSKLHQIVQSALAFNQQHSPLPLTVQQRQAERDAIVRSHLPNVQPSVRWNRQGNAYSGLEASYTVLDFGLSRHREQQGELAIQLSQLDFELEQRQLAADVLVELARLHALKTKSRLAQEALTGLTQLSRYAQIRVKAGLINEAEPLLLHLRIAELNAEYAAMQAEIILKTQLLSAKLLSPLSAEAVPSFAEMQSSLLPIHQHHGLQRQRAALQVALAKSKLTQTERARLPQLAVEGGVGIGLAPGSSKQHHIGLVLKSSTSLLTGGSNVKAAAAAYQAAEQEAKQIDLKLETELARIQLERKRLMANRQTLLQLEKEGKQALSLFKVQFEAATATLSDGLNAHRTLLQTRQQLTDVEAELLVLIASEIRISDGAFLAQ